MNSHLCNLVPRPLPNVYSYRAEEGLGNLVVCGDVMTFQADNNYNLKVLEARTFVRQSHSIPLAEVGVATQDYIVRYTQELVTYMSPVEVFVTRIKIFDRQNFRG